MRLADANEIDNLTYEIEFEINDEAPEGSSWIIGAGDIDDVFAKLRARGFDIVKVAE